MPHVEAPEALEIQEQKAKRKTQKITPNNSGNLAVAIQITEEVISKHREAVALDA